MKYKAKILTSLLLLSWAFMASCSDCDDGSSSSSTQDRQAVSVDSTYTK